MPTPYDLIGDIHGHADELINLLEHLGYEDSTTGYRHPSRKAVFLGDFIDGGDHLYQHRKLLDTVIPMVDNGHALAVMGNHEFNALAFHTQHQGEPLRSHIKKNIEQHQTFINEYPNDCEDKARVLEFFYRLPLLLELDGLRVVHACWHDAHIATLKEKTENNCLTKELLIEASVSGTPAYDAIEVILKGIEVELSDGITFKDKRGHKRKDVRVAWWNSEATTLGEVVVPFDLNIGTSAQLPIPDFVPRYATENPPCFIGHYWMTGEPEPLTSNVACLDYSIAKEGKLVAYRWDGEQTLNADNFTYRVG